MSQSCTKGGSRRHKVAQRGIQWQKGEQSGTNVKQSVNKGEQSAQDGTKQCKVASEYHKVAQSTAKCTAAMSGTIRHQSVTTMSQSSMHNGARTRQAIQSSTKWHKTVSKRQKLEQNITKWNKWNKAAPNWHKAAQGGKNSQISPLSYLEPLLPRLIHKGNVFSLNSTSTLAN